MRTYAIHKAPDNWHAHVQVSRRAIAENGDFALRKDREICTKSALMETRKLWADLANEFLAREGFKERITEKSFEALGIDLEASKHRGWYADVIGTDSRIVQENLEIAKQNEEKILANPSIVLDYLNEKQALCFEVLKEFCEAGTLSRENITELNQKAHTLSEHLNDKNIQILNDSALMKEAFEKLATLPEQSMSERGKSVEHSLVPLSQSEIQRIMTNEHSIKMLEMGVQQQAKFRDTELQI